MTTLSRVCGRRGLSKRLLGLLVGGLALLQGRPGLSHSPPPYFGRVALSAGGSIGRSGSGTAGGVEVTLKLGFFGPSFSLGRTGVGGDYAYLEASYYYFASVGLGAGYRLADDRRGAVVSPFLGVPIPITLPEYSRVAPYFEPYVRPQIAFRGESEVEIGVLLKINFALILDEKLERSD